MSPTDDLKDEFNKLTDEEKIAFMKSIMPSFCEMFSRGSPENDGRDDADVPGE